MNLPDGRLVRSRVVADPGAVLATALDRELTGYAVLEPEEALLLADDARGVLTFADGVPRLAWHAESGRGGPEALADLAQPGPYRVELWDVAADALPDPADHPGLRVPAPMAAERLAGDPALAARTRRAAPADADPASAAGDGVEAVEAFLADEEKIAAIREQARREAERRAAEWDLDSELA